MPGWRVIPQGVIVRDAEPALCVRPQPLRQVLRGDLLNGQRVAVELPALFDGLRHHHQRGDHQHVPPLGREHVAGKLQLHQSLAEPAVGEDGKLPLRNRESNDCLLVVE